ncbi:MAG TPA: TRAP transporter large permease [Firmicutes bacterium]|nr:TRAP transporter large permease [Bacillota bacterium]
MVALLFLIMFALMALGLDIFIAMGVSSLVYIIIKGGIPFALVPTTMISGISYSLLAIPFFMLAGELMNASGITERLTRFAQFFVGSLKGGLAYVAIVVNVISAGVSGSAPADASAVSSVLLPAMRKEKYDPDFAAAINAASATIGPIIPPSIPMVFLGLITHLSVGRLFLGGVIPGLLMGVALAVMVYLEMRRRPLPGIKIKRDLRTLFQVLSDSFFALLAPVIVIVGIVGGVVTIVEAAILVVFYTLIVGMFIYRKIHFIDLPGIFARSAVFSTNIMILFAVIGIFSWIVANEQLGQTVAATITGMNLNKYTFLLAVNILFLFLGMIMDAIPAMLIFFPVLLPIALDMGIDPTHFGVVVVLNLMIGLLTPPVGALLFLESKIAAVPFDRLARRTLPYIAALLVVLAIATYIPWTVTFLPNLLMGQ